LFLRRTQATNDNYLPQFMTVWSIKCWHCWRIVSRPMSMAIKELSSGFSYPSQSAENGFDGAINGAINGLSLISSGELKGSRSPCKIITTLLSNH
jgi:hypothetical protein